MPFTNSQQYIVTSASLPSSFKGLKPCPSEDSLSNPNQTSLGSEFEQSSLLSELRFGIDTYYGPKLKRIIFQLEEAIRNENSGESSSHSLSSPKSPSNPEVWECTPAGLMVHAIRIMSHTLSALQTTKLSPELYIQLFSSVEVLLELFQDSMRDLLGKVYTTDLSVSMQELSLKDLSSPYQVPTLNWYEVVQVVDRCIPRLYLMLSVSFASIQLGIGDSYEMIRDLTLFLGGCQHPLKAIVLRHYFASLIKKHCKGLDKSKLLPLILDNFIGIHKAWVRHQFNGFLDQRELRSTERIQLQPILTSSLQLLKDYCGDATIYSTQLLPVILEHIVASRDSMTQLYFMDILIETFPMPYHLLTVDQLMTAISGFCKSINIQPIVIALITRLSDHLTQSDEEVESFLDGVDSSDLAKILDCFWSCLLSLFNTRHELQLKDVFEMTLFIVDLSKQFHATRAFIDRLAMSLAEYLTKSEYDLPDLNVDPAGLEFVKLVKEVANIEMDVPGIQELLRWLVPRCRFELTLELLKVESIPMNTLVSLIRPVLDVPLKLSEFSEAEADTLISGFTALTDRIFELNLDHLELWTHLNVSYIHPLILPFLLPKICQNSSPEQIKKITGQYVHRLTLSPITIKVDDAQGVFAPEYVYFLAIEVLVLAAVKFSESESWSYDLMVESLSVYEQSLTIMDRQLDALNVFDLNLPALKLSPINATVILDKLTTFAEKLLKRSDRAKILCSLANHYIRCHLEDGLCNLLIKLDKNLSAMQISDIESYNEHRLELLNIGMELVKASKPPMSLSIDHLNMLIVKHCQDRKGLMEVLVYNDELRIIGKCLDFAETTVEEEVEEFQEAIQMTQSEEDSVEHVSMLNEGKDEGFGIDDAYVKPKSSYSFIADLSDTENPF